MSHGARKPLKEALLVSKKGITCEEASSLFLQEMGAEKVFAM